jgi:hypothetical protein
VAAAGLAAEGLAQGRLGVEGGDGEHLVAGLERVAAPAVLGAQQGDHVLDAIDLARDGRRVGALVILPAADRPLLRTTRTAIAVIAHALAVAGSRG